MSLTGSEILELDNLLESQRIRRLISNLNVDDDSKNPNYRFLLQNILRQRYNEKDELVDGSSGIILEGSSRSGKTWSSIDAIIWICLHIETSCKINIYRATFAEFKDTLYDDFKRRLDDYDLPNPFHTAQIVRTFKIGNNTISFKGCDKLGKTHGAGADYVFFNEMIHIPKGVFDQAEMRCRKFWWGDYNPSVTEHYIFDNVIPRDDVGFLRTTFLDNPHLSPNEKNKILGYEPWEIGSYEVHEDVLMYKGEPITEKHQPPPNLRNVKNGTADEFMWKVYGLGLRGAMTGVIFPNTFAIDKMPDLAYTYGNDFGFTVDPNALVRYAEDEGNIYVELLWYAPVETASELAAIFTKQKVEKDIPVTCDSSDKYTGENKGTVEMVREIKKEGWKAFKVSKKKSVMFWLLEMKKKKIHLVRNRFYKRAKKELENYKLKEVHGIIINQPIDKHNHFIDGMRYAYMARHSKNEFETKESLNKMGVNY